MYTSISLNMQFYVNNIRICGYIVHAACLNVGRGVAFLNYRYICAQLIVKHELSYNY